MVDSGSNGMRDKGCQHLNKLESEKVERIDLKNWSFLTGRDGWMKVQRTGWVPGGRDTWRRRPRRSKLITTSWNDQIAKYID